MFISQSNEYKDQALKMSKELDIDIVDFRMEEENNNIKDIYTTHVVGEYANELSLKDESNGTRKLFGFIPRIINALQEGKILVVDELDAKLHPMLLKYIVSLFTDPTINKNKAQLIMTSHDLSILNNKVLHRDEIWFVAKGNEQNSVLYSLVEFKDENNKTPRNDAKYDKQYLEGKYGANLYLKKIIDWGNDNE